MVLETSTPCGHSSTATAAVSKTHYLIALLPLPRTFEDIHLRIRANDWFIHLPVPVSLEVAHPEHELEPPVAAMTHPWALCSALTANAEKVHEHLTTLFRCDVPVGTWVPVTNGIFAGCRVRLSVDVASGGMHLKMLSPNANLRQLLDNYLKREGLVEERQLKEAAQEAPVEDLRKALLAEVRLLKSAFCSSLIETTLAERVPLVTPSSIATALNAADLISDWRNVASGADIAVKPPVDVANCDAVSAACKTTDFWVKRLLCSQSVTE
uniref:Uncharacterized protein n=1 Tax=Mesocestoides corti TaxID=53468 RepID=A0A5K3FFU9_MESCO